MVGRCSVLKYLSAASSNSLPNSSAGWRQDTSACTWTSMAIRLSVFMRPTSFADCWLPPLQGEGWGGDGFAMTAHTHPHPVPPLEGEGTVYESSVHGIHALSRRHAQRAIEAYHFAVQSDIAHHVRHQPRELLRL